MVDNRKWYLSMVGKWDPISAKTPRTREKVSCFFDREIEEQFPVLKPSEKATIKVYEYGSSYDWGEELPILIVCSPYYALYYDTGLRKVFVFKGRKEIEYAFQFAKNMANRYR